MKTSEKPPQVFRIGRGDPWSIRPPRQDNRFDISDPDNPVMTLYVGETLEAALAEVLAQFRTDLEVISELDKIPSDDDETPATGKVPKNWLQNRVVGIAVLRKETKIVDLTQPETIAHLRNVSTLAAAAIDCGFLDLDSSALKASGPTGRKFTQTVSAYLYNKEYNGIRYASRLGDTYYCIAGFVALRCSNVTESEFIEKVLPSEKINSSNSYLQKVAQILNLKID